MGRHGIKHLAPALPPHPPPFPLCSFSGQQVLVGFSRQCSGGVLEVYLHRICTVFVLYLHSTHALYLYSIAVHFQGL